MVNPLKNADKPIIVMGGAPCLASDMQSIDHIDAIRVSCNHHAAKFDCDYIAYIDVCIRNFPTHVFLNQFEKPTISPNQQADFPVPLPSMRYPNTGVYAIYLASQSGQEIIIAGMELYKGDKFYTTNGKPHPSMLTDDFFYQSVRQIQYMTAHCKISVVSGVLTEYLPTYHAA